MNLIDLQGEVKRTTNRIQKSVTEKFDYQKQKKIYKQEQKIVPNAYKPKTIYPRSKSKRETRKY